MKETMVFGRQTTRIGFGCGSLMQLSRSVDRKNLLAAAYDLGIRYFDVAPMYGLGKVEGELGHFLQGKRDQVTLATKFGIVPHKSVQKLSWFQPMVRALFASFPALKEKVKQVVGAQIYYKPDYNIKSAKQSFENSLHELRTDHIDILLLHEPSINNIFTAELQQWLESLRSSQAIKGYGVAGYMDDILPVITQHPWLGQIVQIDNNAVQRQIFHLDHQDQRTVITFSAMSRVYLQILHYLTMHPDLKKAWSELTDADFYQPETVAYFLLSYALSTNPFGIILFSTTHHQHLAQIVRWTEAPRVPAEALTKFMELLDNISLVNQVSQ